MADTRSSVEQLARLKRHLEVDLSEQDVERLVRGGAERRQRRRNRRMLGTGLLLGAVGTALIALLLLRWPAGSGRFEVAAPAASRQPAAPLQAPAGSAQSASSTPEIVTLRDQSRAIALEPNTRVAVVEDAPERVHMRLERGRARFEVTRRPERSFTVRAGNVTVSVVGTTFGVEMVADRVGVTVEKGAVEVDWGLGQKQLLAGESGWFPPLVMGAQPEATVQSARSANDGSNTPAPPGSVPRPSPRSAQQLLTEVDAARAAGHTTRAVELLREILRDYPNDPRAPLAAFTLGRVLLNELGRPREAAVAFQQVRQKAPASQFAEDALAREVEAWARASEPARARALATVYLERYPSGRHARRVKALATE
jgi:transmembrane sensor